MLLLGDESGGASDPLEVAVVVDAHHETAAEADEADDRLEGAVVGPEIEDADLGLGEAVGGLDGGNEVHPLLQQVVGAVCGGNALELEAAGRELDSFAGEGEERLEQEILI